MARFVYLAKNISGKMVRGSIDAINEKEARVRLRSQSLIPQKIAKSTREKKAQSGSSLFGPPPVKSKDLQIFFRQFSTMIESGITVVESLVILGEGAKKGTLKTTIIQVGRSIETGRTLGEAMAMHPRVFDRLSVNMINAGEDAGALDKILNKICEYIDKSEGIKRKVKGALAYPVIVVLVAILVIALLLVWVVPKFMEMFASSGQEAPWLTAMVVDLSNSLTNQWYYFVGVIVGVVFFSKTYFKTKKGAFNRDKLLLNLPLFGSLVKKSSVARMSRTLATLLSSGVSVLDGLTMAAKTCGNAVIEQSLEKAKASISTGKTISGPLSEDKVIPNMVVQMIAVGEESGTMDVMLGKVADFYEDEVDMAVETLGSLIEPIIMVVLGGVVGVIVVAMYLPIFQMANVIGG